ncbi:MAG TPA: response regulator [Gammaproteobacteria bacterium]|nr:response regulator [Gammaproteobacteria bacterium]
MSRDDIAISDLLVMLVEPSSTQQRIVQARLEELGIADPVLVREGAQALREMRRQQPDLVISTLYLPDMSGSELLEKMRGEESLQDIPFILISSETRIRYLEPIRQAGALAILPKPFSRKDLRLALSATLDLIEPDPVRLDNYEPESVEVLIVDDSALSRKHIRSVLASMGMEQFTEAGDGAEALELLQERYFDLVVTDYNMPNMDGRELIDQIRNSATQPSIPVLMVTSEQSENRLAAVQQAGVSAICNKPFDPASLRALIEQIL